MPDLRAFPRLIGIAVLCVLLAGLHGVAAAAYGADPHCPSISEPHQTFPGASHPVGCCTKLQCCPILLEAAFPTAPDADSLPRSTVLDEHHPFLLVRALYPPPKPRLSCNRTQPTFKTGEPR